MNFLVKSFPILFFISFLPVLISCSQSKEITSKKMTTKNFELLAKDRFTENYAMEFNASKSYMLCFNKEDKLKDQVPLTYFIYDVINDSLLFEETIGAGSVKWLNDYQIEISPVPGIVKGGEKDEDLKLNYIYDLRLQKKIFTTIEKDK